MTASAVPALTSPWPADAGYYSPSTRPKPLHLIRLTRVHAACATPGCGRSIHSDGGAWRHTETLQLKCPGGQGWAESFDPARDAADIETALQEQANEIMSEAEDSAEQARQDGFDEGRDEGVDEGRKEMHAEIDAALNAVELADIDDLRAFKEALAAAWNRCVP